MLCALREFTDQRTRAVFTLSKLMGQRPQRRDQVEQLLLLEKLATIARDHLSKPDDAQRFFRRIIELDPKNEDAMSALEAMGWWCERDMRPLSRVSTCYARTAQIHNVFWVPSAQQM